MNITQLHKVPSVRVHLQAADPLCQSMAAVCASENRSAQGRRVTLTLPSVVRSRHMGARRPDTRQRRRLHQFIQDAAVFCFTGIDALLALRLQLLLQVAQFADAGRRRVMALLRAVGIPCRFHGFTIDKPLPKGAITGLAYWVALQRIIHSWVEVNLEGALDRAGRLHPR